MKQKTRIYPGFLVWQFTMDRGEIKDFDRTEMDRNLESKEAIRATAEAARAPFEQLVTLNSIAVFIRGRFEFHKDGHPPSIKVRGHGGDSTAGGATVDRFRLIAVEDNSSYHCLLPRDRRPRFWQRQLTELDPKQSMIVPGTPNQKQFLYLADGRIVLNDKEHLGPKMLEIPGGTGQRILVGVESSLVLRIWLNEEELGYEAE